MKRTVNRMIARLAMFLIAIVLGAIAVAQANRGVEARRNAGSTTPTVARTTNVAPIPIEARLNNQPIPQVAANSPEVNDDFGAEDSSGFAPAPTTYDARPPVYEEQLADTSAQVRPVEFEDNEFETTQDDFGQDDFADDPLPVQPPAQPMTIPESAPATEFAAAPDAQFSNETTYDPPAFDPPPAAATYDANDFGPPPANNFTDNQFSNDAQYSNDPAPPPAVEPMPPVNPTPRSTFVSQPPTQPDYRTANAAPNYPPPTNYAAPEATYSPQTAIGGGGELGNGKPGPSELEGVQTPSLSIQKKSPPEVQVGQPAKFHVTVRNGGQVAAHDVVIRDEVPHGTRLVKTNPPATRSPDGALLWKMGTIRPGSEVTTMMEIMPMEEGDVGSVATVAFQTSASARTVATQPRLTLEHTTDRQALVGEEVLFRIKLANTGTGAAKNVTIEENVPHGLQHYDGNELEYRIGTLQPGESRMLELTLKADEAGLCENGLIARADGNIMVEDRCEVEIVAPQIRLELTGPRRRFLERQANYEIHVANPGSAAARNVELVAHLPRALKFVSTNNAGSYDSQRHEVVWNLNELPAQEMGTVELKTLPTQMGSHSIQVEARANMGLADAVEHNVSVEGLVALLYTVTDVSDPIEVGGQTTYEIHVVNQGSKTASNLQVGALIPAGMEAINGEGPTRVSIEGPRVVFDPLPRLSAQADTFYKIHVKGTQPGDKRIQVQMKSDDLTEPVTKEESTHVYADE